MAQKVKAVINVPLNRVEGDLEVRVELDGGRVSDAWSSGTMYRGFEQMLVGRGARDGLVITPRVCGICSTSHLTAAVGALDMISGASLPPDAVRIRNIALMTEYLQNDLRHAFLMFAVDFTNPAYKGNPLFEEASRRCLPLKGETVIEVIRETKKILEITAILGGQWPHSSYMVPGGITTVPKAADLLICRQLLARFRKWYENRILGCALERWLEVKSGSDLDAWLDESDSHRESDLGFYIRFARSAGLHEMGRGHDRFISFGALPLPEATEVRGHEDSGLLIPAGFVVGTVPQPFEQEKIAEHVAYSWFEDYKGGKHPFEGETRPYATGHEGGKYSWAKAPRYDGLPAETGPLAEMIVAQNLLFVDLTRIHGPNVFTRELARLVRPTRLIPAMEKWLAEATGGKAFYTFPGEIVEGRGVGLTHGPRGALGHWVEISDGRIERYQIITPTAWNASPRDSEGVRGPWEEALVGTEIRDATNPVELGHIIRSFDPCLVCTVHAVTSVNRTEGRTGDHPGGCQ
jgi:hydrogenase large subunit